MTNNRSVHIRSNRDFCNWRLFPHWSSAISSQVHLRSARMHRSGILLEGIASLPWLLAKSMSKRIIFDVRKGLGQWMLPSMRYSKDVCSLIQWPLTQLPGLGWAFSAFILQFSAIFGGPLNSKGLSNVFCDCKQIIRRLNCFIALMCSFVQLGCILRCSGTPLSDHLS